MNTKEKFFVAAANQWTPLINKTLSRNYIQGLDRDDLRQEILLVLWECFVKSDVEHFSSYLSRAIHNKVTDLYASAQGFYFPSLRLRCNECGFAVLSKPKKCPECGHTRWHEAKGKPLLPIEETDLSYEPIIGVIIEYPEEINYIADRILDGKKTGYKQKARLREYMKNEWNQ